MAGTNQLLPFGLAVSRVSSSTEDDVQGRKNPWYVAYFRALGSQLFGGQHKVQQISVDQSGYYLTFLPVHQHRVVGWCMT